MRLEIYRTGVLHETGTTQRYPCMAWYPADMTADPPNPPKIRITIDGRVALTVAMAAERKGVAEGTMSSAISRDRIEHDGMLDGKKKIYLQSKIDAWWPKRPGKGWRGKGDLA